MSRVTKIHRKMENRLQAIVKWFDRESRVYLCKKALHRAGWDAENISVVIVHEFKDVTLTTKMQVPI